MEISITDKGMPQRNIFRAKQANINRRSEDAPGCAGRESAYGDRTIYLIVDFLAGLFALF
jgi:hypothetical protein